MRGLCVLGFSDQLGAAAHSHFCVASLNFVLCRCIRVGRRVRVWELCVLGFSEALDAALHRSRIAALSFVIEAGQQARGERKDVRGPHNRQGGLLRRFPAAHPSPVLCSCTRRTSEDSHKGTRNSKAHQVRQTVKVATPPTLKWDGGCKSSNKKWLTSTVVASISHSST